MSSQGVGSWVSKAYRLGIILGVNVYAPSAIAEKKRLWLQLLQFRNQFSEEA